MPDPDQRSNESDAAYQLRVLEWRANQSWVRSAKHIKESEEGMSDDDDELRQRILAIIARGMPGGTVFPESLADEIMSIVYEECSEAASAGYYDGCGTAEL